MLTLMLAGASVATATAAPSEPSVATRAELYNPGAVASLPPGGNWTLYNLKNSEERSQQLVRAVEKSCLAGTTSYPHPMRYSDKCPQGVNESIP